MLNNIPQPPTPSVHADLDPDADLDTDLTRTLAAILAELNRLEALLMQVARLILADGVGTSPNAGAPTRA